MTGLYGTAGGAKHEFRWRYGVVGDWVLERARGAADKARAHGWRWRPCFVHSRPSIRCGSCRYVSAKGDEGVSCDGLEQWGYAFGMTFKVGDDTLYSD